MLDFINKVFGPNKEITAEKSESENTHDVYTATCALFLEMAQVDGEFDDAERKRILKTFKNEYGLSDEIAQELSARAEKERQESIDLWQFTNRINENYSEDEKIRIVELLWKLIYSDGKIDHHEDYLIHRLATLLEIRHDQLIAAKLNAK